MVKHNKMVFVCIEDTTWTKGLRCYLIRVPQSLQFYKFIIMEIIMLHKNVHLVFPHVMVILITSEVNIKVILEMIISTLDACLL